MLLLVFAIFTDTGILYGPSGALSIFNSRKNAKIVLITA